MSHDLVFIPAREGMTREELNAELLHYSSGGERVRTESVDDLPSKQDADKAKHAVKALEQFHPAFNVDWEEIEQQEDRFTTELCSEDYPLQIYISPGSCYMELAYGNLDRFEEVYDFLGQCVKIIEEHTGLYALDAHTGLLFDYDGSLEDVTENEIESFARSVDHPLVTKDELKLLALLLVVVLGIGGLFAGAIYYLLSQRGP